MSVIYWVMREPFYDHEDQEVDVLLSKKIDLLVDDLVEDDGLRFKIEPVAPATENSDVYQFAVYSMSGRLLVNSTNVVADVMGTGFSSAFNFEAYLVQKHDLAYKAVVHDLAYKAFVNDFGSRGYDFAVEYIFQELMQRVVREHDEYEIVSPGDVTHNEN